MTAFINAQDEIVTDGLSGLLRSGRLHHVARLKGFPHTRVVVRTDHDAQQVAVISGGGAGHEPAHAAYVGEGMLTAAVVGDLFASPSADAVLAAILAVTGDAGCLLVVKNYTGDRLNFGLAAERAKQQGLKVEMVIVGDDIALPEAPQPRGIAGTVLVHKLAGYLSANNTPLAEVKQRVQHLIQHLGSIGLALRTTDILGQPPRAYKSSPELGLGIHGEPGAEKVSIKNASHAISLMVERLEARFPEEQGELIVMLNNLGSVTPIEMDILTDIFLQTSFGQRCTLLIGPAPVLTALNMYGISLSVTPATEEVKAAMLAPVASTDWPGAYSPVEPQVIESDVVSSDEQWGSEPDEAVAQLVKTTCEALVAARVSLDELDSLVGDGDTGSTLAGGANAILQALDEGLPLKSPDKLLSVFASVLGKSMGGSIGVLLSSLFTAAAAALARGEKFPSALEAGITAVQTYGGAKPGDRTMLDALVPAATTWKEKGDFDAAVKSAREGVEKTRHLEKAGAGRSSYLRADSLKGNPDPGAQAVAIVFEAAQPWVDEKPN